MKRFCLPLLVAVIATVVVTVSASSESARSLWVTSDGTKKTYNITTEGILIKSFETPNGAFSSIAVDPADQTLWGANEGIPGPPGKLVNYDRTGTPVFQEISAEDFKALGPEGLAPTISPNDDTTLWVVDDPDSIGRVPTVYNISRTGDLISFFPVSGFDPDARSPQGIAYDRFGASPSLWISDNSTAKIYNVTLDGKLIQSFPTDAPPFVTNDHPTGVENPQGITVESPNLLWITARDTSTIYRVTKTGDEILASFSITGARNLTGVAIDGLFGLPDIGEARAFAMLGLPGAKLKMKDVFRWTGVVGDVGLGPDAVQDFDQGLLTGTYKVDPAGDDRHNHDVVISGESVVTDLSAAVADALAGAAAAAALPPDQVFGDIKSDLIIVGGPGLNVIEAKKIELDHGETLTLSGDPSSEFVFNLSEKFKLKEGSSIVLSGGIVSENVLFNLLGDQDSAIESGSVAIGRILAPAAKFKIKDEGSMLLGAIIGGREIKLEGGGRLRAPYAALPVGSLGQASAATALALPGSKLKISDSSSTLVGDVLLGPLAEQAFDEGEIDGTYIVDPAGDNSNAHNVIVTGGTVTAPMSGAVADAVDASSAAARLAPDQEFGDIKSDLTIVGRPGLNVIEAKKIELDRDETLTLGGEPTSVFVFNLDEKFKLKKGSSVVLSGGVVGKNVLFNVLGGKDSAIESGSTAIGTLLAPHASKVMIKDSGSILSGAVIGGRKIIVEKGGAVVSPSP